MSGVTTLLKTALPGRATKGIANGIGCTLRQAERMLTTGRIPGALREAVIRLAMSEIERRQAELEAVNEQLKKIAYAEMVARADDRRIDATHRKIDGATDA